MTLTLYELKHLDKSIDDVASIDRLSYTVSLITYKLVTVITTMRYRYTFIFYLITINTDSTATQRQSLSEQVNIHQ